MLRVLSLDTIGLQIWSMVRVTPLQASENVVTQSLAGHHSSYPSHSVSVTLLHGCRARWLVCFLEGERFLNLVSGSEVTLRRLLLALC